MNMISLGEANNNFIVLGINDGHHCSATLCMNGQIIASYQEERFSRIKSDAGFPMLSLQHLRKDYPELMSNIDHIALTSKNLNLFHSMTKRYPLFGIKDFILENQRFWGPRANGKNVDYFDVMKEYIRPNICHYPFDRIKNVNDKEEIQEIRLGFISDFLKVGKERIVLVDHHLCHASHAYYSSPFRGEDVLVFTMDGSGDGYNGTVHEVDKEGKLHCLYRTSLCNLARVYQYITFLLGMKPAEHEYKVMGLAAYAKEKYIKDVLPIFEETYYIDNLEWKTHVKIDNHYEYFKEKLEGKRFDAIAGALQAYAEKIVTTWIGNWLRHTGKVRVVLSGGASLNIKVNKKVAEMREVRSVFVCMAGGDESLSIGAAQQVYGDFKGYLDLIPITSPYLGPAFNRSDIANIIEMPIIQEKYQVFEKANDDDVAELLASGKIVAVLKGPMEFGPRALGHRSILADPRDFNVVKKINEAIKNRDFWMPFTPSILDERKEDYVINPKNLDSPYMTMAFDSTELAKREIPAAIHAYDRTLRPQFVKKEVVPDYHSLIKAFEKKTGVGVLLNTSLNYHGIPIVRTPIELIRELIDNPDVDLDCLYIEDVLLVKKT